MAESKIEWTGQNEMIGPREHPQLLDLQFSSEADRAFYVDGPSVRSRIAVLYGKQTHMAALARPMALYRPWIVDYFEQLPALPLWIARDITNPYKVGSKQRAVIQKTVVSLFDERPRLKDIMRRWGITQPIRKLRGRALLPRHGPVLRVLAGLNPSLVSQAIPSVHRAQRPWLNAIRYALDRCPHSAALDAWFVRETGPRRLSDVQDMLDFWRRGDGFDLKWSWPQAAAARDRWHRQLGVQTVRSRYGIDPDAPICRNPLPDLVSLDGYDFNALRTPADIQTEGTAMHHCVASYIQDVLSGNCAIVSMTEHGKRIATLEFSSSGRLRQIKGRCNSVKFMKGVRAAANKYEGLLAAREWNEFPASDQDAASATARPHPGLDPGEDVGSDDPTKGRVSK